MRNKAILALLLAAAMGADGVPAAAAPDQQLGLAIMSASVNSGCALARGAGAAGATPYGQGICDVTFDRRTDNCAYAAVIGDPDAGDPGDFSYPGGVAARPLGGPASKTLRVRTENAVGTLLDMPFHLIVFCAK